MPNYCNYEMKVVGKKENIEEFIKIMNSNYNYRTMEFDYERHMGGGVFEAEDDGIRKQGDLYETIIMGDCAWSVHSCMFDDVFSYYHHFKKDYGDECRSTTIPIESQRLSLDIEIYSEEPGCCFQEHYLIMKGDVEIDDCVDYYEYCLEEYETKEEAEKDLEIEITDEEWENEEYISRGGYEEWTFSI